ncbi:hypothetical protein [Silvanigrella aquatica]|uniref:Uncharacterized protein n=1 Tax=Silvanigrella aquatica TaxID=1915309 RepID=A0A1L4CYT9_9BACT|nr:hypothetical protein [Silvanigrella aquatica]APJ03123.1 hypothetical protein AXG55_04055 [Silvanigrella aquatica]
MKKFIILILRFFVIYFLFESKNIYSNAIFPHPRSIVFVDNQLPNDTQSQYQNQEVTFVFCYSPYYNNWYWLKDDSGKYIKVMGLWKNKKIKGHSFRYFLLNKSSYDRVNFLESKCTKMFGDMYHIAQPSDGNFHASWHPFAFDDDTFAKGRIDLYYQYFKHKNIVQFTFTIFDHMLKNSSLYITTQQIEKMIDKNIQEKIQCLFSENKDYC